MDNLQPDILFRLVEAPKLSLCLTRPERNSRWANTARQGRITDHTSAAALNSVYGTSRRSNRSKKQEKRQDISP